jgi:hypothetical protein|nr:MAG TPA: hypothetical protein [Caudoviricetes sp.]
MAEETKKNEVSKAQEMRTQLSVTTNNYMKVIKKQMDEGGANFDEYSGKCVMSAMAAINNMIHGQGLTFNDLNASNVNEILIQIATLRLNANAVPRECYFQVRNVNVGGKGQQAQWEKQIEMGIEGDGNDAILARFGRDVKKVCQVWLVREKDKFVYPKHNGLEMTAPQWEPTGQGEVIRVVYPIIKTDNTVEYYIGERRDVVKNLYAHISNNMMNETFGLVKGGKKRYDATPEEKKKIDAKKKEFMDKARSLGDLDKILDCEELSPYISPAWKEYQSREQMIIRKMRNNVTKKIPKDFDSALTAEQYNMTDDTYKEVHAEIEDFANSTVFDTTYTEVSSEPEKPSEPSEPVKDPEPKQEEKAEPEKKEETAGEMPVPDWMNV